MDWLFKVGSFIAKEIRCVMVANFARVVVILLSRRGSETGFHLNAELTTLHLTMNLTLEHY